MTQKTKAVLIAGGAGFIGSHLCDLFLNSGYRVICMDNIITGSIDNIKHNFDNDNFQFIEHDISDPLNIDCEVDYILNFASPASPVDYMKYPVDTLKAGSFGTYNMLNLALKKKAVFLMASTSEVYGDPLQNPQKESYWGNANPVGPRSVYDEAKRFSEAMTMAYHRLYKLDTRIVRIFNTYGPRMRQEDGRAVPNFITQAISNKPITIYGTGYQTRSFCYISDLIDGIYRLLFSDQNDPVNIGNPNEMSLMDLAKIIINLTNCGGKIVFNELPADDPKVRRPDISKAISLLNWQPKVSVETGLINTIDYFRKILRPV